ncbi:beta-lactamase family protein [Opitutaceae bacterium]|nr:beta-lactamase family protein [Opitutaceae bacterium]
MIAATSSVGAQLTEKIDAAMSKFVAEKEISGAVTMAIYQGDIIHFSAVGIADQENAVPMTKNTVFRIASLTKNYSALLVKILEEQGKLSVYDKVEKYLPEFGSMQLQNDDGEGAVDLRIWHLMTHTSGVDIPEDYNSCPDLETSTKKIAARKLHFRPGTRWKYSKGMDVCGRIVEIVSGKAFDIFLKEEITDPLGLADTAYWISGTDDPRLALVYMSDRKNGGITPEDSPYFQTLPRKGVKPNPSSGLFSSTRDVGVYYSMLLNGGVHDSQQIVSEESIKELTRNWTGTMKTNPITGMSWGLGFGHVRKPAGVTANLSAGSFGHGGAYGTQAWVDPATKIIYILMIQRRGFGNGDMSEIRKEFQRIVSENYKLDKS